MVQDPRRLSNGAGLGIRIFGVIVALVFMAGGALFVALAMVGERILETFQGVDQCINSDDLAGIPSEALPPGIAVCGGWMPDHVGPVQLAGLVIGGAVMLLGGYIAVRCMRAAAWLEGTVLRVRGAFRSRRVDLATADITVGMVTHTRSDDNGHHTVRRVPTLAARDPASGRRLTLALNGAGMDRLPPADLRALADAMIAGRPVSDVDVWRVASQLHQMADNPLDLPLR